MTLDKTLIAKYNQPVPRYTSYPPANHFAPELLPADTRDIIAESNAWNPQNISFYIHIPFCNKLCFYCGCNSCPISKSDDVDAYISALKKEIGLIVPFINKERKISQIHFGGGTPNSIASDYLHEIIELLSENFKFIADPEIAIECHPAYLDINYIEALKKAGFNRFSLGIQDFNPQVLRTINREPSAIPLPELMSMLRSNDTLAINLDFIYGLPGQTAQSFLETLEQAIELNPDRLVTFSYAHVPWVNKNQLILEKKGLPTNDEKMDMFERAKDFLTANGYAMIGLDHYVKPEDELNTALQSGQLHRNFQGYCTRRTTGQVYAFGASAISQLDRTYLQNTKTPEQYVKMLADGKLPVERGYVLNQNEMIIREAINGLMCNKTIDFSTLAKHFGLTDKKLKQVLNFDENKVNNFAEDGLLTYNGSQLQVTESGSIFIRNVAALFDPMLANKQQSFSKSI